MSVSSISHVETFDFASNEYLFAHVTDTLIAVPHRPIIAPRLWPSPLTQRTIAGERVRTLRRPRIGYMNGASPAQAHRLGADHRAPSASATRRAACTSLFTFSCNSSSRLRARSRKQLPHPAVVAAALTVGRLIWKVMGDTSLRVISRHMTSMRARFAELVKAASGLSARH